MNHRRSQRPSSPPVALLGSIGEPVRREIRAIGGVDAVLAAEATGRFRAASERMGLAEVVEMEVVPIFESLEGDDVITGFRLVLRQAVFEYEKLSTAKAAATRSNAATWKRYNR